MRGLRVCVSCLPSCPPPHLNPFPCAYLLSQQRLTLRVCGFLPHSQSMQPKVLKVMHTVAGQSPVHFPDSTSRLHTGHYSRVMENYTKARVLWGGFSLCPSSDLVSLCVVVAVLCLCYRGTISRGSSCKSISLMLCNVSQKHLQSGLNIEKKRDFCCDGLAGSDTLKSGFFQRHRSVRAHRMQRKEEEEVRP